MTFTKFRSNKKEWLDDFSLSGPDLKKNLQNLKLANRFLGGNILIFKALEQLIIENPQLTQQPLNVVDIGCGGGDILRTLSLWARKKFLPWIFIGVDANPVSIEYATELSGHFEHIQYLTLNVFDEEFQRLKFDIILLCTICHHFSDIEMVKLLSQLSQQAKIGIIISDLHRHWISFYAIKLLTQIFPCSYLEKHDGPLSVLKAFKRCELIHIMNQAGISGYQIKWRWPFRYQILIKSCP